MLMDQLHFDPTLEVVSISAIAKDEVRPPAEQTRKKLQRASSLHHDTEDYVVSLGGLPDLPEEDDPCNQNEQPTDSDDDPFSNYMHDALTA
jgi:hypothetical protein